VLCVEDNAKAWRAPNPRIRVHHTRPQRPGWTWSKSRSASPNAKPSAPAASGPSAS
jgi:hypothetical protein